MLDDLVEQQNHRLLLQNEGIYTTRSDRSFNGDGSCFGICDRNIHYVIHHLFYIPYQR
jgi:hypothetical protein